MHLLNINRTGLTLGLVLAGMHLLWSILVALGVAQALYDFILWAHMIHLAIVIGPFEAGAAVTLIVVTFVVGYVIGALFAWIWNWLHR